jgi:pimeloyl-ACP methyl ester carboxylesterase
MSAAANSERMVDLGGYRLRLCCAGQGTPAVVIDAGLGEGLNDSIGGLHMQLYAASYPAEIAGLVLVDSSFPDMKARLEPVLGSLRTALLWRLQAALAGEGMTQQDWTKSFTQVAAAGQLPDVPLVVISAGQPAPLQPSLGVLFSSTKIARVMQAGHAVIAKSSSKGRHIIDDNDVP